MRELKVCYERVRRELTICYERLEERLRRELKLRSRCRALLTADRPTENMLRARCTRERNVCYIHVATN